MRRLTRCAALAVGLAMTSLGCEAPSPITQGPGLDQSASRPSSIASAGTVSLGAGDRIGAAVFGRHVAWVRRVEPLPEHLQLADSSSPYIFQPTMSLAGQE